MNDMKYLTEREKELLNRFPKFTQEDVDGCNDLFRRYMIYQTEKEGRRVWTSCCHHDGELLPSRERTETPERAEAKYAKHNDFISCPFCGKTVQVKCRGKFQRKGVEEQIPVVFLHTGEDGEVFAQAYYAHKNYAEHPSGEPVIAFNCAYHFSPGRALQFWKSYGEWYAEMEAGKIGSRKIIREPFGTFGPSPNKLYKVIFAERLDASFARYCNYRAWVNLDAPGAVWCDDLMRWLTVAAIYPRQLEMLIKAGQRELINDLIWESKKNVKIFDWSQTDPRKAFRMTSEELRLYIADGSGPDALRARRALQCAYTEAREWLQGRDGMPGWVVERFCKEARQYGLTPQELRKYLLRFTGPRCYSGWFGLQQALTLWEGYVENARQIGYDLTQRARVLPRDLEQEHENASEILRKREENRKKGEKKKQNADARAREDELNRKYGFETAHFLIRAPKSMDEIIAEGKVLQHCVGGYAARHAEGAVTILFLRDKAHPRTPLCTIEVSGDRLVQIHGFQNEREKGSVKPELRFAEIYEPWSRWLKAGTPRNQDGTPRVPKKRGVKTA